MNAENTQTILKATTRIAPPYLRVESGPLTTGGKTLAEFAAAINRVIDPPEELSADDIIVRSLLLVSGGTNLYGGRFGEQELRRIAELAVDSPVLVGHRKDTLPIARVFQAEVVNHEGELWVRARFYWLKKAAGADTLATNIDGGLYKECSLGFTFMCAECSVCGSDIRSCPHAPENSSDSGAYYYRDIQRVLEISLVYRGATPNTKVGATLGITELAINIEETCDGRTDFVPDIQVKRLCVLGGSDTHDLPPTEMLALYQAREAPGAPAVIASAALQDDLPLMIGRSGGELFALRDDGAPAPDNLASAVLQLGGYPEQDFLLYGRLSGMRGKQRRSLSELARRLNSGAGPVRSFKLRALALLYWDNCWSEADNSAEFQDKLENLCNDCDRLAFAPRPKNSVCGNQTGCEHILALGPGQFKFLRMPGNPGTLCRPTENGAPIQTLLVSGIDIDDNPRAEDACDTDPVVSLKFDRVVKQGASLRLVNSRICAQLGALCGAEEYLFVNSSEACDITSNTTLGLSGPSGQRMFASLPGAGDMQPGVCHILKPQAEAPDAASNVVNMSIGSAARYHAAGGENSSVRMIELLCGDRRLAALLADERTPDVPARK
ncbi:MAG: hypothetical protein IH914_01730 [candidate division Zixibacteria bacterium]|nr:hypothetical protein [candidate division Zixibacteria bacterium]